MHAGSAPDSPQIRYVSIIFSSLLPDSAGTFMDRETLYQPCPNLIPGSTVASDISDAGLFVDNVARL